MSNLGIKDLTGQKFGKLTVLGISGRNKYNALIWMCKCDCGNYADVLSRSLITGHTKSCGCIKGYKQVKHNTEIKYHGGSNIRLYHVWVDMKQRCINPNKSNYVWYGAKGISVCDEWKDFEKFKEWAYENGYDDKAPVGYCTLDRIDNDKDYEPQNCRWVSMAEQNRNKSYHRYVEYHGEKYTVTQLADKVGMNKDTLVYRLNANWSVEDAVNKPIKRKNCGCRMVEPQESEDKE